jgi:hypothetical protein
VGEKVKEQIRAVVPISAFLFLFQLLVIRKGVGESFVIAVGLTCVVLGLMFFMEGLRLGLMPLGQNIGAILPAKARLGLILGFGFVLGIGATFAEPAISTLKTAGGNVRPENAALLFDLLGRSSGILVASVAVGVGIATVLGIYRFVAGWSLKLLLWPTLALSLALTLIAELNPGTSGVVSLAWDTGAVTTGPVTVPLVLALGLGVSAVLGRSDTGMSGFGIVTLASLWPVVMVLAASLVLFYTGSYLPASEAARLAELEGVAGNVTSFAPLELLAGSMLSALQAIVPLALLLCVMQRYILREEIRNLDQIALGVVLAIIGLVLFNIGLGVGLVPLGQQVGSNVPAAFAPPEQLYGETAGRMIAILFAFAMGYGATLAEPALNALGKTVEDVTAGAFKMTLLIQAVALGVGAGLAVGLAKIMFAWPLAYLVVPSYVLLILLTLASEEKYVNIGWDSAGVTTGPITVPLVLATGLGIGLAVGVPEGFGMLAMASIGPILTVLGLGLLVSRAAQETGPAASARPAPTTASLLDSRGERLQATED